VAQTQALLKILDNQQKLAKVVTKTFSSSESLTNDLKKKIKKVEQKLATIATPFNLFFYFDIKSYLVY